MGTDIRADISKRNKWWISKDRYLELYHFCLQYNEWKKTYAELEQFGLNATSFINLTKKLQVSDPTSELAVKKAELSYKMKLVEDSALLADDVLAPYIFKAVTEGLAFPALKTRYEIPCERDMYYDRFRKFFWLLSRSRN